MVQSSHSVRPARTRGRAPDLPRRWPATFAALRHRNFRLWFVGQTLSVIGTWAQSVAQGWVVYELTRSELALGAVQFFGSLPTLFLMIPAGVVADRLPKRRVVLIAQTAMMLQALTLAGLAALHRLQPWHVALLAACNGVANSFEAPARHAMAVEMVDDRRDLMNAVALNSTIINTGRVIGPAIGGLILARFGAAPCFAINGLSFLAVLAALLSMRLAPCEPRTGTESVVAQVRVGMSYIWRDRPLCTLLALVGVGQLFGFFHTILMPAYAAGVLHVGETGLGTLNAAVGVGALTGSLLVASMAAHSGRRFLLVGGALLFPLSVLGFSVSRSLAFSALCLALNGMGFVAQNATINTMIQGAVPDDLRGRVMAVYILLFFGSTPFASLMAGTLGQMLGVRAAVAIGAAITLGTACYALWRSPALRRAQVA